MSHEAAAENASKAAYVSAISTAISGLSLNEWAMIVGIIATIITLLMNWYYKQRQDERGEKMARERHFSVPEE